jgi:hypothetical protein
MSEIRDALLGTLASGKPGLVAIVRLHGDRLSAMESRCKRTQQEKIDAQKSRGRLRWELILRLAPWGLGLLGMLALSWLTLRVQSILGVVEKVSQ